MMELIYQSKNLAFFTSIKISFFYGISEELTLIYDPILFCTVIQNYYFNPKMNISLNNIDNSIGGL